MEQGASKVRLVTFQDCGLDLLVSIKCRDFSVGYCRDHERPPRAGESVTGALLALIVLRVPPLMNVRVEVLLRGLR